MKRKKGKKKRKEKENNEKKGKETYLLPGTKISEFSADFSPKYRFSVSLEKKNAWKIRLPEKSCKNREYRRFFDGNIGHEQHALGGALTEGEIAVFFGEKINLSPIYRPFFRKKI